MMTETILPRSIADKLRLDVGPGNGLTFHFVVSAIDVDTATAAIKGGRYDIALLLQKISRQQRADDR